MKVNAFGLTDIGKKRKNNEDGFLCSDFTSNQKKERSVLQLLMVADGVGGHLGGEMASSMAVEILKTNIEKGFNEIEPTDSNYSKLIDSSIQDANRQIFGKASITPSLNGMGTTIVAALIYNSKAFICNIGDSRAYLIRQDEITQVTNDHSWAASQLRQNILTEKEILNSPFRHTITRSLGFEPIIKIDMFKIKLQPDDYLLLCSDGLYESLSVSSIKETVKTKKKPKKICHALINNANEHGGHDNITAVVANITQDKK